MSKHIKFVKFPEAQNETGSPDSDAWHAWRASGIGASDALHIAADAGLLVNKPSFANGRKLMAQKLGLAAPVETNAAMQRGKDFEPLARKEVEERLGTAVLPKFGESLHWPWMKASFDGLTFDGKIIEIKVPRTQDAAVHQAAKSGEVVEYYRPQLAQQMMVLHGNPAQWTGDEQALFFSYHPESGELAQAVMTGDNLRDLASELLEAEHEFVHRWEALYNSVEDIRDRVDEIEKAHEQLIREYAELDAIAKTAKDYIRQAVEEDGYAPERFTVSQRKRRQTKLDQAALRESVGWVRDKDIPEQYRKSDITIVRLFKPEVTFTTPEEAEKAYLKADAALKQIKERYDEVKKAISSIVEPVGYYEADLFTVFRRSGGVDWKKAAADLGLDLDQFTSVEEVSYTVLSKKRTA